MRPASARAGLTLLELIIVMAIIAIAGTVTTITLRVPTPALVDSNLVRIEKLRLLARQTGRPVYVLLVGDSGVYPVTAYPDSRILGAEWLKVDQLSGNVDETR